jgi:N-acetylglutamate synthase-like GNAT family acetyltransferase
MSELFRLPSAVGRDADVDAWFLRDDGLRLSARPWFEAMRGCGPDVRELLHDGCPTACVGDVAFGYVNAFRAHAAVGFFHGAELSDPAGLLEGSGKRMRHVKLRWGEPVDEPALQALIAAAYRDVRGRAGLELENFTIRPARAADIPAIAELLPLSIHGLQAETYSRTQREAAIGPVFGVDTRLIEDGSYFVVEAEDGSVVGCGGWSFRHTPFGGDDSARDDAELDPATEAARIRAFFVHPDWARQGIGSLIMRRCEAEAEARGFRRLELTATLAGEPLYARHGFEAVRRFDFELPGGERLPLVLMEKAIQEPG